MVYEPFNTEDNFSGGKIYNHIDNWTSLTGDKTIYNIVIGKLIEFDSIPFQDNKSRALVLSRYDQKALDKIMDEFVCTDIVEKCSGNDNDLGFFSNIFPVIKKDGSARVILNLKELNKSIRFSHFKMDTVQDLLQMMFPLCYFLTVDFKHAYFSVYKPRGEEMAEIQMEG